MSSGGVSTLASNSMFIYVKNFCTHIMAIWKWSIYDSDGWAVMTISYCFAGEVCKRKVLVFRGVLLPVIT